MYIPSAVGYQPTLATDMGALQVRYIQYGLNMFIYMYIYIYIYVYVCVYMSLPPSATSPTLATDMGALQVRSLTYGLHLYIQICMSSRPPAT